MPAESAWKLEEAIPSAEETTRRQSPEETWCTARATPTAMQATEHTRS